MVLTFKTKKDCRTVLEHLTDSEKFVSVHPLIYKMEKQQDNTYRVFEKMKIGFFTYSFSYKATISKELDNAVRMTANIKGLVKIEMDFRLTCHSSETIIEETITIQSRLPVSSFMNRVFKKQHQLLFQNIELKAQ